MKYNAYLDGAKVASDITDTDGNIVYEFEELAGDKEYIVQFTSVDEDGNESDLSEELKVKTMEDITSITIAKQDMSINIGEKDTTVYKVEPRTAYDDMVFTKTGTAFTIKDNRSLGVLEVFGEKKGSGTITSKSESTGITKTISVKVNDPSENYKVTINVSGAPKEVGQTADAYVSQTPQDVDMDFEWSVVGHSVELGKVSADKRDVQLKYIEAGSSTIYVKSRKYPNVKSEYSISVKKVLESFFVRPPKGETELPSGEAYAFTAIPTPEDAPMDLEWKSTHGVIVSEAGNVAMIDFQTPQAGVVVTCNDKISGKTESVTVNVIEPQP